MLYKEPSNGTLDISPVETLQAFKALIRKDLVDLTTLIDQTFLENDLFELLQFDIEENFDNYLGLYFHINFISSSNKQITVTEIIYFNEEAEFINANKAKRGQQGFFEIYDNYGHIDLEICRLDKTGKYACVKRNHTYTDDFGSYYAEDKKSVPMSEDEIKQAFQELAALFETQTDIQNLRTKKAV